MIRVLNGYLPNPRKVFLIERVFAVVALEPTWDLKASLALPKGERR
jgi:hypothetical protein